MPKRGLPERCVAFDIGGTALRAGRFVPGERKLTQVVRRQTPSHLTLPDHSVDDLQAAMFVELEEMARSLLDGELPDLVGFAFPGPIDPAGYVLAVPTAFGPQSTQPRPIGRQLAERWPAAEICLLNDVTAAGYYHLRTPGESFCITTVSSGVGNKVFVGGKPVVGSHGRGGEIGHIVVDRSPEAPRCDCGGRGHLGAIASGRGALAAVRTAAAADPAGFRASRLSEAVQGQVEKIDNNRIVDAFRAGDPWVTAQLRRVTTYLAQVLASIHNAVGTERFVMIGGFALALGEPYRRLLAQLTAGSCWDLGQDWNAWFELGDDSDSAGMIGAALAAMEQWEAAR